MTPERSDYFAYGSNMESAQMMHRCKGARLTGRGVLEGFRFVINSRGVASIVDDPKAKVHGLVWSVTAADLANLDLYEGVKEGYYARKTARVVLDGRSVSTWVYVAADNTEGRPRPGYLERIVAAAKAAGLPEPYVKELESAA